jgi:hypothetical protein
MTSLQFRTLHSDLLLSACGSDDEAHIPCFMLLTFLPVSAFRLPRSLAALANVLQGAVNITNLFCACGATHSHTVLYDGTLLHLFCNALQHRVGLLVVPKHGSGWQVHVFAFRYIHGKCVFLSNCQFNSMLCAFNLLLSLTLLPVALRALCTAIGLIQQMQSNCL